MTPAALVIQDWGQFQSPGSGWEACPYRRATSSAAELQSQGQGQGFNTTKNPMIIGILDQSLATWYTLCLNRLSSDLHGDDMQAVRGQQQR